jgi:lipopolysaccharide transport system ATP-binding protein
MPPVIKVENLGKKYTISHQQREEYSSLRDVFTNGVRSFSKKLFSPFTLHPSLLSTSEDFWALKDVSFEVNQGDRIGIIGRNGAGKSTLLKILSRITDPTTGSIRIRGRVASLLEVGTGFHPELTGRENIYLNGAILGMGRAEIKKKFDEIVDFAEIERFLDTPVKRYSSGMYVRLAFAVAAHLEPEILIVDEVLAVGDAEFQKKCLGKLEEQQVNGRTVIFVSHNMGAIRDLCSRVIVLKSGEVLYEGTPDSGIHNYLETVSSLNVLQKKDFEGPLADSILIQSMEINGTNANASISPCDELIFTLHGVCLYTVDKFRFSISVINDGFRIFTLYDTKNPLPMKIGTFEVQIAVPPYILRPGLYTVGIGGHDGGVYCGGVNWMYAKDVANFQVEAVWSEMNDFGGIGVVNIPCSGKREWV